MNNRVIAKIKEFDPLAIGIYADCDEAGRQIYRDLQEAFAADETIFDWSSLYRQVDTKTSMNGM